MPFQVTGLGRAPTVEEERDDAIVDRTALLCALFALGLCGLTATAGMVVLTSQGREIPPALAATVGTSLGAIGGLVGNTHSKPPRKNNTTRS